MKMIDLREERDKNKIKDLFKVIDGWLLPTGFSGNKNTTFGDIYTEYANQNCIECLGELDEWLYEPDNWWAEQGDAEEIIDAYLEAIGMSGDISDEYPLRVLAPSAQFWWHKNLLFKCHKEIIVYVAICFTIEMIGYVRMDKDKWEAIKTELMEKVTLETTRGNFHKILYNALP